jgi:ABC-2 type transport system permease protein
MKPTSVWTLAKKELVTLLNAPTTYVIAVVFLLMTGWFFTAQLFVNNQSTLDSFLGPLPLIFTFIVPALSMRTFAEEYRTGTIEYLSTLPLHDWEIVLAKYLAAMGLLSLLLVFTMAYPIVLYIIGRPDPGQIVGGYIALIGMGSLYTAIGLWASSLTRNQVVSLIIGFFVCFAFFVLNYIANFFPEWLAGFIQAWSVEYHFAALARGVLDSRDILYWVSGSFFFLAASLSSLHARRWR